MSKAKEPIIFYDEDDQEIELEIVEQTTIAGQNYLLVVDEEVDEALLLKEISGEGDYVSYEPVVDEVEEESIMKVFSELVEDFEFEW